MNRLKIGIIEIFMLLGLAFIFNYFDIKICPFFNFFNVPCPGCGLTRSIICLLHGDFLKSIQYNVLGIPIVIFCCFYVVVVLMNQYDRLEMFFLKYRKRIIVGAVVVLILVECINLRNPLLSYIYK